MSVPRVMDGRAYDFGNGTWGWECQRCGSICSGQPVPVDWADWSKGFSNGITTPEQAIHELGPTHTCRALVQH